MLFPINEISISNSKSNTLEEDLINVINKSIKNHKISESAHEEIYSLQHSDPDVAKIFFDQEIQATNTLISVLESKNIQTNNIKEKAHLIISMIDNLCHEIVYHKHKDMNYDVMKDIVVKSIITMLK